MSEVSSADDGNRAGAPARNTALFDERLSWETIIAYGTPAVGVGYMYLLINLFVMKFSTDVLLIAPAIMGTIFGVSRVWDAVSDPICGYLSDRTTHRMGRRRIWLLAGGIPIALTFIMVFSPPATLEGGWLVAWMAVAIIGFYSATTIFMVPHMSLGPELTLNYHERSRLYGLRHAWFTIGSIVALASMQALINAERESETAVRSLATQLSIVAGVITIALIVFCVVKIRERKDFQGRVNENPFAAFRDVWRNHYARLVLIVTFIENVGSAVIGLLTLYVAQYVVGTPKLAPLFILAYMIPSSLSVPMWVPISRRVGKIRLWVFSMMLTGLSFGGMFSLAFIPDQDTRVLTIFVLAFFAGLAAGCGGTISPSVQSDIIDYDDYVTGERKEGSYFAAFNFVYKSAAGVMIFITGYVLQFSGFVPNQVQTMTVQVAIVTLYGLFPLVCYLIGAAMFSRFTLNEAEHSRIRAALAARDAA